MRDFAYARAATAGSVVATLADPGAAVIAGGTELLNWFRLGIAAADRVVDIGGLDELRGISRDGDELRIGALATLSEIGEHPLVTRLAGALASACLQAASAQVRNRATIGGNVLQRTRCPYFRAEEPVPWPCNKREPGSGCASLAGRHERQAIFGWTPGCVAVQPSDPAVALAALDAQAEVLGPAGPRTIPMREFHLTQREAAGLGEPLRETRLGPDELITGYRLPASTDGQAYVKVRERASYEYAIVSAAAAVRLTGDGARAAGAGEQRAAGAGEQRAADAGEQRAAGAHGPRIAAARIALGSVAQRPWRLPAAEAALPGTPLTRQALTPVIERAMADAAPLPGNGFKVTMARAAAVRGPLGGGRCVVTVTWSAGPSRLPRVEGPLKLTGAARYAADHQPDGVLHAVLVGAPVAAGRLRGVDAAAALALPGVTAVLTAADLPRFPGLPPPAAVRRLPFSDDRIRYEGEPVAIVLAESVEAAEAGREAVVADCEPATPVLTGQGRREPAMGDAEMVFDRGDVDAVLAEGGLAGGEIRVEQTYVQAARHHHAMETSGTVARWDGGRLTLWDSVQASSTVIPVMSAALGVSTADVHVIAPHTGGGFGAKGYIWPHEILAAAAARVAGRPVKLHLRRSDQFSNVGYQPWMEQTIRLAATAGGVLLGLEHSVVNTTALADTHVEPATEASKSLYAVPALRLRQLVERVSLNVPTPMRAPVEGPGLWALESAMNELAAAAGLDPLDVRLANFAETSPADGRPWSANGLREAYEEGARRYGWRTRHERPRRDGPWVIGHGMATCTMGSFRFPGASRVRLHRDGAIVEANVHDIGTGVQTVLSQIAAEELGISPEQVEMRWGDTDLPATGPTYGSSTTMGTGSAVAAAARDVTKQLAELGQGGRDPLEGLDRAGIDELVGEGTFALPGDAGFNADGAATPYAMRTWGVIFVEVGVDPDFGLLRLRRAVGVYSAGRIVNPVTARAQMTGGIIWGWGKATMEESDQEPVHGRWLAKNLSNVAVPVNADIPADIDVAFTDEYDEAASLIGARGIGELGATGVDAAVAAAVHDAVGVRVRELPILPWKVLAG